MKCPFPGCNRVRQEGQFACYTHWVRMTKETQEKAMQLLRGMDNDALTERDFYHATQKIIAKNFAIIDCERLPADPG
jgi:hypothetical protein